MDLCICAIFLLYITTLVIIIFILTKKCKKESFSKKERFSIEPQIKRFSKKERIDYYLGGVKNNIYISLYNKNLNNVFVINKDFLHEDQDNTLNNPVYLEEMKDYYAMMKRLNPQYAENQFLFLPGDVSHSRNDIPFLTKTRPIENKGKNVLLPFNVERHWGPIFSLKMYDIPYEQKKNIILWRGAATGRDKRINLVEQYYNFPGFQINIGFTNFIDNYQGIKSNKLIKKKLHLGEMLQCKFLLSVEGNDVASNLKWILASNSLCIKPKSEIESWLMEGKLKPWVHYVPVRNDFKDLLKIYNWCINNNEKCKQIIKNANEYIKQFLNPKIENEIIVKVLEGYASKVHIIS